MPEQVFTNATIAGPVSVYVKDGRIVRIRPLQVDEKDLKPWTIADATGRPLLAAQGAEGRTLCDGRSHADLLRGPASPSHEEGRLRPGGRAASGEPGQVRIRADQLGRGARHRGRRDGEVADATTVRPRSGPSTRIITTGASWATGSVPTSGSSTPSGSPRCSTIPTAGKAGTGALRTSTATGGSWGCRSSSTCSKTPCGTRTTSSTGR